MILRNKIKLYKKSICNIMLAFFLNLELIIFKIALNFDYDCNI